MYCESEIQAKNIKAGKSLPRMTRSDYLASFISRDIAVREFGQTDACLNGHVIHREEDDTWSKSQMNLLRQRIVI